LGEGWNRVLVCSNSKKSQSSGRLLQSSSYYYLKHVHINLRAQTCLQMLAIALLESSLDHLDHIGYPRTAPDYLRNEELLRDVRNKLN